jgi:hypothetical protein
MKKILLLTFLITFFKANAQYSEYYTVKADINENINVSGHVHIKKNISTIDYGKLALANAQNEKTRLENLKYQDAKQKQISLEIASDPTKAYDYGFQFTYEKKGNEAKSSGFRKFKKSYRIPHSSLFVPSGAGRLENVSSKNITTEIIMFSPTYNKDLIEIDLEKNGKMENVEVGKLNERIGPNGESIFVHKKDLNRATVFGVKGFKSTLIWEDDYQYTITDNFASYDSSIGNGVMYHVKVRTYGDKDEVTFEELEGRRYYLRRLIEKFVSTALVTNMKY